jgi:hypothetical protein
MASFELYPQTEGEEMISWRFALPAILVAAAVAGGITYFAILAPLHLIEAGQRSPTTMPKAADHPDSTVSKNVKPPSTEDDITAYQRAADAILKRAQNAKASADEPPLDHRFHESAPMSGIHLGDEAL